MPGIGTGLTGHFHVITINAGRRRLQNESAEAARRRAFDVFVHGLINRVTAATLAARQSLVCRPQQPLSTQISNNLTLTVTMAENAECMKMMKNCSALL